MSFHLFVRWLRGRMRRAIMLRKQAEHEQENDESYRALLLFCENKDAESVAPAHDA